MDKKYIFIALFLMLIPLCFQVLRKMELEKYFKQGSVLEIRAFYIIISTIMSELLIQALERILYFI